MRLFLFFVEGNGFIECPFSTFDNDNDDDEDINCAEMRGSGWWFKQSLDTKSNLNGVYSNVPAVESYHGIQWETWKDERVSLKGCEMKMRCSN